MLQSQELFQQDKPKPWECKRGVLANCFTEVFKHEGHGMIEPVYIPALNRYRKDLCPCEKAALKRYKQKVGECEEREALKNRKNEAFSWLGVETTLAEKTFMNFDERRQPRAFSVVRRFVDDPRGTLVLHGPPGTGKTHLLAALVNALHDRGTGCLFVSSTELFDVIQDRIADHKPYRELTLRAMKTPLLVLDDIDKPKHTEFREELYFAIINARVNRNLPTALSTNRLAELQTYVGEAVVSRFTVGQIAVAMVGNDYRPGL
jgi:DNA replication protein DnaC